MPAKKVGSALAVLISLVQSTGESNVGNQQSVIHTLTPRVLLLGIPQAYGIEPPDIAQNPQQHNEQYVAYA